MSTRSEAYLRGVPMKRYDMIREGLIVLGAVTAVVVLLAVSFGTPDYPTVTGKEVATKQPMLFLQRSLAYFSGQSGLQTYGPPYTKHDQNAQEVFGFISPARWIGVVNPVDARHDLAMDPLERIAVLDPEVAKALAIYTHAPPDQQQRWIKSYSAALRRATDDNGRVVLPQGDYGAVATLMNGMLSLARAGLLEGTLDSSSRLPYDLNNTKSLLFLEGPIENNVARHLNELGNQWGMTNEMGPYPGAWWLWSYAFLYQLPGIASSPNADLIAGLIMATAFLVLIFLPVIPGLNRIPYRIPVYRLIWRDWYRRFEGQP
ncbi:MAG: hypothetical protein KGL70_15260 [Betaproteobacteria bacterium]|nr:hypothetical protein [Betaproteobacteria bacterium]